MSNGSIVEQGTHSELMELQGFYLALVNTGKSGEKDGLDSSPDSNQSGGCPTSSYDKKSEVIHPAITFQYHVIEPTQMSELHKFERGAGSTFTQIAQRIEVDPATPNKTTYSTWTLLKFGVSFGQNEVFMNAIGLFCCLLAGAEESVNAILLAESTISLSLSRRYSELLSQVGFWSLMYLMLAVLQIFAFGGQAIAFAFSSERMMQCVRESIFRNLMQQDTAFFDVHKTRPGALISLLTTDATNLCSLSGANLGLLYIVATTLISAFTIGCGFGWKLAPICSATIPIILVCGFYCTSLLGKFADETNAVPLEAANQAVEAISEIRTVAIITMEQNILDGYHYTLSQLSKTSFKKAINMSLLYVFCQSVTFLCMAFGFWYGGQLLARGEYSPLQFFVTFAAIIFGARSAGYMFTFTDDLSDAIHAAGRLKDLFSSKRIIEIQNKDSIYPLEEDIAGSILFDKVLFRYPNTEHVILNSINLDVKSEEHIAIVGPSGSGKSSIISLIERFHNPTHGSIFVGGHNISTLSLKQYRSFLALVSQDITLYEGTFRENITLRVDGEISDDDIYHACAIANLTAFVTSLSDGLSTYLGTNGGMLSGGQKQRVSIARAVLCKPRLLLLDEATSALDSASEAALQVALENAGVGRTTITIAHRLNTMKGADRIHFLEGGRFVEVGTHEELMRVDGRYAEFVKLQEMHEN